MISHVLKRVSQIGSNCIANILDAPVLILLYHRVADLSDDPEMLAVSPVNFDAQMRFLKENFRIHRFEEQWPSCRPCGIVITFDDGYRDNLHQALPILEKYQVPATFFISAGAVGSEEEFWWDRLSGIVSGMEYQRLQSQMKPMKPEAKREVFARLPQQAPRRENLPLSLEELRQLATSPLATIGSHTVNHIQLSALSYEEQSEEIVRGHRRLEEMVGRPLEVFSYPFGNHDDYNQNSVEICRDLGIKKVAASYSGQAHRWSDQMQLPRKIVRNWNLEEFRKNLSAMLFK